MNSCDKDLLCYSCHDVPSGKVFATDCSGGEVRRICERCLQSKSICPAAGCKQPLADHTDPDYAAGKQLNRLRKLYEDQVKTPTDEQPQITLKKFILMRCQQNRNTKKDDTAVAHSGNEDKGGEMLIPKHWDEANNSAVTALKEGKIDLSEELGTMLRVCKEVHHKDKEQKERLGMAQAAYKKKQEDVEQLQKQKAKLKDKFEQQKDELSLLIWTHYEGGGL